MSSTSSLSRVFAKYSVRWQQRLDQELIAAAKAAGKPEEVWEKMSQLIERGANVNIYNGGKRILVTLAERGADFLVAKMIKAGANPNDRGSGDITPFMMAAKGAHVATMKVLAKAGVKLAAKTSAGHTALDFLLESADKIDPTNRQGRKKFRDAYKVLSRARHGMDESLKKSVFRTNRRCAFVEPGLYYEMRLLKMVQEGNLVAVKQLLKTGAHPDSAGKYGVNRALYDAIQAGNAPMVQALVEAGAKMEGGFANTSASPLQVAAKAGAKNVFKALVEAGADPLKPVTLRHLNGGETVLTLSELAANSNKHEMAGFIEQTAQDFALMPPGMCTRRDVTVRAPLKLLLKGPGS